MDYARLLYDNVFSIGTPVASSAASGYAVTNVADWRTTTHWMATTNTTQTIRVDCGGPRAADMIGIAASNLAGGGASVAVEASNDNWASTVTVSAAAAVSSDAVYVKKFTSASYRYWGIKITGASVVPCIGVLSLGSALAFPELIDGDFAPIMERTRWDGDMPREGRPLLLKRAYRAQRFRAAWKWISDIWFRDTFMPAWDAHLRHCRPFFFCADYAGFPGDAYYLHVPPDFSLDPPLDALLTRSFMLEMQGAHMGTVEDTGAIAAAAAIGRGSVMGVTWTERANPKLDELYGVTYSSSLGLFCAVGDSFWTLNAGVPPLDAYIITSPDGITWTERTNAKEFCLNAICWTGSQFVAVGNGDGTDAYIVTSPDGITWTERANPKNKSLTAVAFNGSLLVAGGWSDTPDSYLVTSPDGITWTERAHPKDRQIGGVAWSPDLSLWCVVGAHEPGNASARAYIITSPDGITWTERTNPKNATLWAVCWGGGQFVAVGASDGADAYIVTSPDGITWTERANPKNSFLYGVTWTGSMYCAVGEADSDLDAYVVTSPDGITWTEHANFKNQALMAVASSSARIVAVGLTDPDATIDAYLITSP